MCCLLPAKLLKTVSAGAMVLAAFSGLLMLWFIAQVYGNPLMLIVYEIFPQIRVFLICLLIANTAVLLGTMLGGIGLYHNNWLLLLFYTIACILLGLVLLVVGIAILTVEGAVQSEFKEFCKTDPLDLSTTLENAENLLCTVLCPCALDNPQTHYETGSAVNVHECDPCGDIEVLNQEDVDWLYSIGVITPDGMCAVDSDLLYESLFGENAGASMILEGLEVVFGYSGLCRPGKMFYFTDINRGKPPKSPLAQFEDWLKDTLESKAIMCIVVALVFFSLTCVNTGICCNCFKRKDTDAERMLKDMAHYRASK